MARPNFIILVCAILSLISTAAALDCFVNGFCHGELVDVQSGEDYRDCLLACKADENCNWFTYQMRESNCLLFNDCPTLDETCEYCFTGESDCEDQEDEPHWHLIIGGHQYPRNESTIELYNWVTGEQCFLEDFPIEISNHEGVAIDGVPVVCGGEINYHPQKKCYTYNDETEQWDELNELLTEAYNAASSYIDGVGWVIYGNGCNPVTHSQKLKDLNSNWEEGPEIFGTEVCNQCAAQLDSNTTIFVGAGSPNGVVTFDWATLTYTQQPSSFAGNRLKSSCAVIQDKRGQPLFAVAGGQSKGLEIWNPADGFVETISQELPPEVGSPSGLTDSVIVSIKRGREILLYGGWRESSPGSRGIFTPGIFKYKLSDRTWSRLGSMLAPRSSHVVIPVSGMACPQV